MFRLIKKVEIENQKSLLTRFETKESDVEKLIQANVNELKLTRSDNEEKQRLIDSLKVQLKDVRDELQQTYEQQGSLKGIFSATKKNLTF